MRDTYAVIKQRLVRLMDLIVLSIEKRKNANKIADLKIIKAK